MRLIDYSLKMFYLITSIYDVVLTGHSYTMYTVIIVCSKIDDGWVTPMHSNFFQAKTYFNFQIRATIITVTMNNNKEKHTQCFNQNITP